MWTPGEVKAGEMDGLGVRGDLSKRLGETQVDASQTGERIRVTEAPMELEKASQATVRALGQEADRHRDRERQRHTERSAERASSSRYR